MSESPGRRIGFAISCAASVAVWLAAPRAVLGGAGFSSQQEFPAADRATRAVIGDLNNDGRRDVVVILPDSSRIQVFLNLGGGAGGAWGGLDPRPPISVAAGPSGLALGFVDGDGLLDIAVSNEGAASFQVLINQGGGSFAAPQTTSAGAGRAPSDVGFLEGGDVVITNRAADEVQVFDNGTALLPGATVVYGEIQTIAVGDMPSSLEPEDLDNDKDTDVVATNFGSDSVSYLEKGLLFFSVEQTISVGDGPVDIRTGDFDGNGFKDFATANRNSGTVSVVYNTGTGVALGGSTFGTTCHFDVGADTLAVEVCDLDADGDEDILAASTPSGGMPSIVFLENRGNVCAFAIEQIFTIAADPNDVRCGDMDGDGFLDLVTANDDDNVTGGSVTVLLAAACPVCQVEDVLENDLQGTSDCLSASNDPSPFGNNACATTIGAIGCGETLCGTAGTWIANPPCQGDQDCFGAPGGCDLGTMTCVDDFVFRDLDWYDFDLQDPGEPVNVTVTLNAQWTPVLFLFQEAPDCENLVQVFGFAGIGPCQPLEVLTEDLSPGPYKILATPAFTSGAQCGDGYRLSVACDIPCPTDFNGDGSTGFFDLNVILADWGPCPQL